ncbi:hypothetical protein TNCV_2540601 [Trichonephila clavipes]|nr:hypothetical protein TNCV_2540601 [Trichonephila clavipes]
MRSSQHRCMNQAPASENQTQQRSLASSLEDTVGSPPVNMVYMLLKVAHLFSRTHLCSHQSPLSPMARGSPHFITSLILDGPILPCTVYFNHGDT